MTIPPPPAPPATDKASSRATTSLVLGIVGFLCCQLCSPFAWYMGAQELKAIKGEPARRRARVSPWPAWCSGSSARC